MRSFARLSKALKQADKKKIEILQENDQADESLFSHSDEHGNNVLHLAAKHCIQHDADILSLIIAHLNQLKLLGDLIAAINDSDQTPLHIVVEFNTVAAMQKIIDALGNKAYVVARQCDYAGDVPLVTLFSRDKKESHSGALNTICNRLKPYTYYNPFQLKWNELINTKAVLAKYQGCPERLLDNLRIACDLINRCREIILESSTHPYQNYQSASAHSAVKEVINKQVRRFKDGDRRYISAIKEHQKGNCGEFVWLALDIVKANYPSCRADRIYAENKHGGDHVVLVLDCDADYKPNDYRTWGKYAVVCDGFAGCAYPATELPFRFMGFRSYPIKDSEKPDLCLTNIIEEFNPNVLYWECEASYIPPTTGQAFNRLR